MTTRDYEVIAAAFRDTVGDTHIEPAVEELAENICVAFKRDNHRFNRTVFLRTALNYEAGEVPAPSTAYTLEEAKHR